MIYLTDVNDKLQLVRSSAAAIDVQVNYADIVSASGAWVGLGHEEHSFSSAATSDILAVPGSSNTRILKALTARNKDAALAGDITLLYNDNGTTFEKHKVSLAPGDMLMYEEHLGYFLYTSNTKLNKLLTVVGSDVINATTSFADITGLTYPLLSGKRYAINACLFHTNNASTTGSQFGFNIGAAPTVAVFGNYSAVTNSVTAGVMATGTATARDTAVTAQTTGQTAIGITLLAGYIQPSADGTFALRCASEVAVAAGLTVKIGSWMSIREVDA